MSHNPYDPKTDVNSPFEAGMMAASPQKVDEDGVPYLIRPAGTTVESLEQMLPLPVRTRQTVHLHTPESFIRYVRGFAEESTIIFFNEANNTFAAIIDYHSQKRPIHLTAPEMDETPIHIETSDGPRWCEHRAIYTVLQTPEWQAWTGKSGCPMNQLTFAQFIDDHIDYVASKDRDMLQAVALNLIIKVNAVFNSAQVLQNGSSNLKYSEEVEGTTRSGELKIPASFELEISPFHGCRRIPVECRFRYRFDNRAASLWYEIGNEERIAREAVSEIYEEIAVQTKIPVLAGVPS